MPYVSRGQGHLKVMYDTDEEEAQRGWQPRLPPSRGTNRGHHLLSASQWSPISTVAEGRTTLVDTVPTGHGRPRDDAGAYPVDDFMTWPTRRALAGQRGRGSAVDGGRWRSAGYTNIISGGIEVVHA